MLLALLIHKTFSYLCGNGFYGKLTCEVTSKKMIFKNHQKLFIIQIISFLLFCYEIPNNYSVVIYPHVIINTSIDTVFMRDSTDSSNHSSDTLVADYSKEQILKVNLYRLKMEYVDTSYLPKGYFDLTSGDTFHIQITGISKEIKILHPVYDTNNVQMISFKIEPGEDSIYNNEFSFKAKSSSKGYISFFKENYDSISSNFGITSIKSIIICYCISTPEKVTLQIDSLQWSYLLDINGSDTTWRLNRIILKGKTNAFSLKFVSKSNLSWCPDCGSILNIPLDENGNFTSKYSAWYENENRYDLYIQAFPERDKVITLIPPKSKGNKSE